MLSTSHDSSNNNASFDAVAEYEKVFEQLSKPTPPKKFKWGKFLLTLLGIFLGIVIVLSAVLSLIEANVDHTGTTYYEEETYAEETYEDEPVDENSYGDDGDYYIVTVGANNRLSLREEPSEYSTKLDRIENGTRLYIDELDGNWGHTKYNGHEGWVCISENGDIYCTMME